MIDGLSTGTVFLVSFLGALFAILASLLVVYSYVWLRLIPKLRRGLHELIEEIGPRALFERANIDPAEAMQQLDISPAEAMQQIGLSPAARGPTSNAVRVIYTCEDHGRCAGCPRVLAQFQAIIRLQGEDSFDEVERRCYAELREQLAADALLDGENEVGRQHRIATRVIEQLVTEGCKSSVAHAVVWSRKKADRATFAGWLSAARVGCEQLVIDDEEEVA